MSKLLVHREKGFTLIEILIALSLLAILSAVVVPNVIGYLNRGEAQAYNATKKAIQAAVEAYYADPNNRIKATDAGFVQGQAGKKAYPLQGDTTHRIAGASSAPTNTGTNPSLGWSDAGYFITLDGLVTAKYLSVMPASASTIHGVANTGNYSWYVDSDGKVQSITILDTGALAGGFQAGVWP